MNIELTPTPSFPLPLPGLTVTLPLQNFLAPATPQSLFRVDPATGTLVPALDSSSNPIVGVVDPGGLSATFSGIVQLSTVVGLLPESPALSVQIDVKPDSDDNTVNLGSNGVTPIAILSTASFDARTVDPATISVDGAGVRVRGNGVAMASAKDVDGDGLKDLLVQVSTNMLNLVEGQSVLTLTGNTFSGVAIMGQDVIRVVP